MLTDASKLDARSVGPKQPSRPRKLPCRWTIGRAAASWLKTSAIAACTAISVLATNAAAEQHVGLAQPPHAGSTAVDRWSGLVDDAALRTGLPAVWLRDLMHVESNGNALAVSSKGALGLMQLMPATYAALRASLALGADPFAPHNNILAGALYLRLLVDRYGWPTALAAYNAGPQRLDDLLTHGRPLPAETLAYLSRFRSAGFSSPVGARTIAIGRTTPEPASAPLFVAPLPSPTAQPEQLFAPLSVSECAASRSTTGAHCGVE